MFLAWVLRRRSRLQLKATLMLAFAILAIIGADAGGLWSTRQETIAAAHAETENLSRSLADDVAGVYRAMDGILVGLVERVGNDGTTPAALQRLDRLLRLRAAALPMLHSLLVLNSSGVVLVSTVGMPRTTIDVSGSATFAHHRDNSNLGMYVSPPVRSVIDGNWVIRMSRRVNRPDGSFGGVVITSVAVRYFEDLFGSFNVGKKGVILLARREGFLIARSPAAPDFMGRNLSQATLFKIIANKGSGASFEGISPVDGKRRLSSYHSVPGSSDLVLAGRSKFEVLAGWRRTAYLHLLGLSLLTTLICVLGRRLIRGIEENDRSAHQLHELVGHLRQSEQSLRQARDASEEANKALAVVNRTLETVAHQDALTGLANRRHFDTTIELEFRRARRNFTSLSLVLLDVDHFKKFNDFYGHLAGDACLRSIGELLQTFTKRAGEVACRYGGEEMAVLLPASSEDQAIDMAERIAQAVRDLYITHAGSSFGRVTISVGVTTLSISNTYSSTELVEHADKALYAAKGEGRDKVVSFGSIGSPALNTAAA